VKHFAVGEQHNTEQEWKGDSRKEVTDHCVPRSDSGLGELIARLCGVFRTQQVEARHRLAHHSDSGCALSASACRGKGALPQGFFALPDLFETPFERVVRPQHLPHRQNGRQRGEPGKHRDRFIEADAGRQQIGDREILNPHISNFAILFMITTPVVSIVSAMPSRTIPRTSLMSGAR
jgi:hypothetical protein